MVRFLKFAPRGFKTPTDHLTREIQVSLTCDTTRFSDHKSALSPPWKGREKVARQTNIRVRLS